MLHYKRTHFLLVYPLNTAPSQRFRFEQFFKHFRQWGMGVSSSSFYDAGTYSLLKQKGSSVLLAIRLLKCFLIRFLKVLMIWRYDAVFIQRGAAPAGPPVFEWIIRHIFRVPIFYDFDDAIWREPVLNKKGSFLKRLVKVHGKVPKIIKWAHTVIVGNEYLAAYARQFNKNVVVIPTVVDTEEKFAPISKEIADPITIGWTGSHSTLAYLENLEPVLTEIQNTHPFNLLVIANREPNFANIDYEFVKWSEESEVQTLQKIDIGIMPLPDDEWTKGKCGFKAIQYMALGKPAVVSAVGVNTAIVEHGVNGFVCLDDEDWKIYLERLLGDSDMIRYQGINARKKIVASYSLTRGTALWRAVLAGV